MHDVVAERPRNKGFTLVELLVVIGIIALLISILLPSLNKARAQAQMVACQSNLKQFANAFLIYAAENRGYMKVREGYPVGPGVSYGNWAPPTPIPAPLPQPTFPFNMRWYWWFMTHEFRQAAGVAPYPDPTPGQEEYHLERYPYNYVCPKATLLLPSGYSAPDKYGYNMSFSYAANTTNIHQPLPTGVTSASFRYPGSYPLLWRQSEIISPSSKLLLVDAADALVSNSGAGKWEFYGEFHCDPTANPKNPGVAVTGVTAYRHNEGANLAFFDGHVEWRAKREVFDKDNVQARSPATPSNDSYWGWDKLWIPNRRYE